MTAQSSRSSRPWRGTGGSTRPLVVTRAIMNRPSTTFDRQPVALASVLGSSTSRHSTLFHTHFGMAGERQIPCSLFVRSIVTLGIERW